MLAVLCWSWSWGCRTPGLLDPGLLDPRAAKRPQCGAWCHGALHPATRSLLQLIVANPVVTHLASSEVNGAQPETCNANKRFHGNSPLKFKNQFSGYSLHLLWLRFYFMRRIEGALPAVCLEPWLPLRVVQTHGLSLSIDVD